MKPKEVKSKRTYAHDELNILLLKEAFERDLSLFSTLVQKKEGFFEQPMVKPNWTFTVVVNPTGSRELFINVPPKKK
jgi:hypothetical protein